MVGFVYISILLGIVNVGLISLDVDLTSIVSCFARSSTEHFEVQHQQNAFIYNEVIKVLLWINPFLLKGFTFIGICMLFFIEKMKILAICLIYALPLLVKVFLYVCVYLYINRPHIIAKWFIHIFENRYKVTKWVVLTLLILLILIFLPCEYVVNAEYINNSYTFMNWGGLPPSDAGPSGTQPGGSGGGSGGPGGPGDPWWGNSHQAPYQGSVNDSSNVANTVNPPSIYYSPQSTEEFNRDTRELVDKIFNQCKHNMTNDNDRRGIFEHSWSVRDALGTSHRNLLCDIMKDRYGFAVRTYGGINTPLHLVNTLAGEPSRIIASRPFFDMLVEEMGKKNIPYVQQ